MTFDEMFTWRPNIIMPKDEPEPQAPMDEVLNEYQRRVAMRALNLLELEFTMAQVLAIDVTRLSFDWHDAERLIRLGCPHETAVQLLEE